GAGYGLRRHPPSDAGRACRLAGASACGRAALLALAALRPASAACGRADPCARSGAFRARPARSHRAARALSRARFVNDDPREFVFTRYDARHGMAWLAQAYSLFSRKRLPWILLLLTYYVLLKLLLSLPFVGPYAITILKPVFAVGLLAAAWTQERGGTPALSQLFQGFRANLKSLLAIGVFFVVGVTAAIFASLLLDDGKLLDLLSRAGTMNDEEVATALADGSLQAGMLFSALLTIPVLIATWWAPALVVFQNAGAGMGLRGRLGGAAGYLRGLAV